MIETRFADTSIQSNLRFDPLSNLRFDPLSNLRFDPPILSRVRKYSEEPLILRTNPTQLRLVLTISPTLYMSN